MSECKDCSFWRKSLRDERSGTCRNEANMVFFGAPEEENPTPNMFGMTWAWHGCEYFSPPPQRMEG